MKKYRTTITLCAAAFASLSVNVRGATQPPLKFLQSTPVPGLAEGDWDHMCVDLKGNRLFSAHEGNGTVEVFDLRTYKHTGSIGKGMLHEPHSMVYRDDLHRLCVVDGNHKVGALRIFDGNTYSLIKSVDLPLRADWSGYDPVSKYLYINGNGKEYKKPDSTVSVVDTTAMELVSTFMVDDNTITDFALETSNPHIYTGERWKNFIAVIDRNTGTVVARWRLTLGEGTGHMGLDRKNHRLFVNCRYGQMIYFDTETGKELGAFAINQYSDELMYDQARKRIYVTASGAVGVGHPSIEVFQQIDPDHYKSLGELPTGKNSRNGIFVPELNRIFVSVPKNEKAEAQILVFEVL